jgi:predicted negative regulator of RcsB-dependent stress response
MSNSVPSTPHSPENDPQAGATTPVAGPGFEVTLHRFWEKNSRTIFVICAIVLLGIIGKGAYELYLNQQNKAVAAEYASASTSDKLKTFAADHPNTELAGLAYLRLADEAYSGQKYSDAVSAYQRAADALKSTPFAARAQIGLAIAKIQSGQQAEGETKLKELANDSNLLKTARAEANYDLASLAVAAGKPEDSVKYLDAVNALDPSGSWSQRALALRATLPPSAVTINAPESSAAPAIKLPPKP